MHSVSNPNGDSLESFFSSFKLRSSKGRLSPFFEITNNVATANPSIIRIALPIRTIFYWV